MMIRDELEAFIGKINELLAIGLAGTTLLCMYWVAKNKFGEVPEAILAGALLTVGAAPLVWLLVLREPGIADTPPRRATGLVALACAWLVPWLVVLVTLS